MTTGQQNNLPPNNVPDKRPQFRLKVIVLSVALLGVLAAATIGYRLHVQRAVSNLGISSKHVKPTAAPAKVAECVALLEEAVPEKPGLVDKVSEMVEHTRRDGKDVADATADLMVVSYRERNGVIGDVVVQLYQPPPEAVMQVLNPEGIVRARLGDELFGSAQNLMGLLYQPVIAIGDEQEIQRQQRAFKAGIEGDLTLLQEQTIEPLYLVAVMPRAERFLPGSLQQRVQSVALNSELTFGEWRSQMMLLTGNEQTAGQVGNTMAAWRELASSLADTYVAYRTGQPLRDSLQASTVEVSGRKVVASAAMPSKTVVKVTKEMAGYGTQRGCSIGFYKHANHWPPGVDKVKFGCEWYTKEEAIDLLKTPSGGDASLILGKQLIAAVLNRAYGLPESPAVQEAISYASGMLCWYHRKIPLDVPPSTVNGQHMVYLAGILEEYNNSCHASGGAAVLSGSGFGTVPFGFPAGAGGAGEDQGGEGGGPAALLGCSASWFRSPGHWPKGITQLTVGAMPYTKQQCMDVLKSVSTEDASIILAQELIASELNVIAGLTASEQEMQAIADADELLGKFPGRLPFFVDPQSPVGQEMMYLAEVLRKYNNSCHRVADNKGNNGLGNGIDPAPPGSPPENDGAGTGPGNPGNKNK